MTQEEVFKQLTAHAKEYGFVFQSSEIYDGLSAYAKSHDNPLRYPRHYHFTF